MSREAQVPGGPFLNETGTRQAQSPGPVYDNETVVTFLAAWAKQATVTVQPIDGAKSS